MSCFNDLYCVRDVIVIVLGITVLILLALIVSLAGKIIVPLLIRFYRLPCLNSFIFHEKFFLSLEFSLSL